MDSPYASQNSFPKFKVVSACCSVPSIPITITAPTCACGVPGCSCGGCSCGTPGCSCNGGMPSCACGSPGCSCGGGAQSALVIPIQTQTCCRCCQPVCAPACMQGGGCYTGC
uniref:Metallothionein n=1 Tax=Panagrolaimus davidi TaxID=227884 RepID=A0A914QB30_9BILA